MEGVPQYVFPPGRDMRVGITKKNPNPGNCEFTGYCGSRKNLLSGSARCSPQAEGKRYMRKVHAKTQVKKIAEAIILQAVEDLWLPVHKKESVDFFTGEGFVICAKLVDFGLYEKLKLVHLINKAAQKNLLHTPQVIEKNRGSSD